MARIIYGIMSARFRCTAAISWGICSSRRRWNDWPDLDARRTETASRGRLKEALVTLRVAGIEAPVWLSATAAIGYIATMLAVRRRRRSSHDA